MEESNYSVGKNSKRIVVDRLSANFQTRQEIIEYIKISALSSKIILDEDFINLTDGPRTFIVSKKSTPKFSFFALGKITVTPFFFLLAKKYNAPKSVLALSLFPATFACCKYFKKRFNKWRMCKQIDNYFAALAKYATLNKTLVKHLYKRTDVVQDLESKVALSVISMIEEDEETFANFCATEMNKICNELKKKFDVQMSFSAENSESNSPWQVPECEDNADLFNATVYLEKMLDLYILLASNTFSGLIFGLTETAWKSNIDFDTVFQIIIEITTLINNSIKNIENQMKHIFAEIEKQAKLVKTPTNKQKVQEHSVILYGEAMEDCRNRTRIIFDMAKTIEKQNTETRQILLNEMLAQYEQSMGIVKNLLRFEKANNAETRENKAQHQVTQKVEVDNNLQSTENIEDVGSDDEIFAHSPHDSDIEIDEKQKSYSYEDGCAAAAVQNLMLLELKTRMKDVRRIKITRTKGGDLIVQQRPITLVESGRQIDSKKGNRIEEQNICPIPPPLIPLNFLNQENFKKSADENISGASVSELPKSLLSSITSIAKIRKPVENVFAFTGEDYIDSDDETE